jgi:hypothetical protein
MHMTQMKVFTKQEYVDLILRVTTGDYERLKKSIKDNGLLNPIIINQDNLVLDGHHRLRVCNELKIPVDYEVKNFAGKPLAELKYVVTVNADRRHLNEYQRGKIALKMKKIASEIAAERKQATQFTSESGKEAAAMKRFHASRDNAHNEDNASKQRSVSQQGNSTNRQNHLRNFVRFGQLHALSHSIMYFLVNRSRTHRSVDLYLIRTVYTWRYVI